MKTAIVTGGTKGIGKCIAEYLLKRGYYVFVTYAHDADAAAQAAEDFSLISANFHVRKVDQSLSSDMHAFTDWIKAHCLEASGSSTIDCIICNAGATVRKPADQITDDEWERTLMVGLNCHYYLVRDLWSMIPSESRIIFIGSMMAVQPHGTSLAYGVMKAAVHALAKNLVKSFEGTGTTVNVIAPGFVDTDWQKEKPQEIRDNICRKTAIHRFAEPEEISGTVGYLLDNGFVNGAVIEVSGGYGYK